MQWRMRMCDTMCRKYVEGDPVQVACEGCSNCASPKEVADLEKKNRRREFLNSLTRYPSVKVVIK